MMISTRGRYALRILVDLAEHQADSFVPLKEIAERQEISEKYLESIVKELVRAKILKGLRGKGGGYRLARAAEDVCVLDVLSLTEGSLASVACLEEGASPCPRASRCRTLPLWKGLDGLVRDYLKGFSIRDLAREDDSGFDYVI